MESLSVQVETRWRDYSADAFEGEVFTLTVTSGRYLLAALPVFITLVSSSTWVILSFALHQFTAKDERFTSADGLHFQLQTLLRHPSTPPTAIKDLLFLAWAWRSRKDIPRVQRLKSRLVVPMLCALATFIAFTVAGIFVTKVAHLAYQSNNVLLRPAKCGAWSFDLSILAEKAASQDKNANDTRNARAYAQNCYGQGSTTGICSVYPVTIVAFNSSAVPCPFGLDPNGENTCLYGRNQALQFDTGLLSSNQIFGINTSPSDQIQVRKVVTCSPFHAQNYLHQSLSSEGGYTIWNFGLGELSADGLSSNYTYSYNTYGRQANIGFSLYSVSTVGKTWQPVPALTTINADLSAHFLSQNTVVYDEPVNDIWFAATRTDNVITGYYKASQYTNVLVCAEQHQLVNPVSGARSSLGTVKNLENVYETLGFNPFQEAIATRFMLAFDLSSIFNVVTTLGSSSLLASDRLTELVGTTLPDDQWQIEVSAWFETSLARLQWSIVDYNVNVNLDDLGSVILPSAASTNPVDQAQNKLCSLQRIRNTGSYQTFSFWGVLITALLGSLLLVTSWTLEWCVARFRRGKSRSHREIARVTDSKYQLLRKNLCVHASDDANMTKHTAWEGTLDTIPVAKAGVEFSIPQKTADDYRYDRVADDDVESGPDEQQAGLMLMSTLPPSRYRGSAGRRSSQAGEGQVLLSSGNDESGSRMQRHSEPLRGVAVETVEYHSSSSKQPRTRNISVREDDEGSL